MKKKTLFFALAMAALCALPLLASCAGGSGSDTAEPAADGSYTLVEDGKLTVAASLDFPPFENLNDGNVEGFEVDLMKAIAEQMGLECNYLPTMKFDTIIPAIVAGVPWTRLHAEVSFQCKISLKNKNGIPTGIPFLW
ncbi:MAG: transporter substrate-binding domain-containing protein, partial [Slackia piriformis]|nr:transporter substrate-binding domain-containing protein [Slackia piriformis]